jgi:rhodanese-related sulfurtransferase
VNSTAVRLALLAAFGALVSCRSALPRVSMNEFERLLADGRITVIDVRTPEEYQAGHIPGAWSVPLEDLDSRATELESLKRPIVTYCSCLQEEESLMAVATLQRLGIKGARALAGGYNSWAAVGRRVVSGPSPM